MPGLILQVVWHIPDGILVKINSIDTPDGTIVVPDLLTPQWVRYYEGKQDKHPCLIEPY